MTSGSNVNTQGTRVCLEPKPYKSAESLQCAGADADAGQTDLAGLQAAVEQSSTEVQAMRHTLRVLAASLPAQPPPGVRAIPACSGQPETGCCGH